MGFWDKLRNVGKKCVDEKRRISELEKEVSRLEGEYDELSEKWGDCSADRSLMVADLNQAARDIAYLQEQHVKYGRIIAFELTAPRFKTYTKSQTEYDPWNDNELPSVVKSIVDNKYLCFSEGDWKRMLATVYAVIKKSQLRWEAERLDCDNFADIAGGLIVRGGLKAGLEYESCFGWARSRKHAFNVYRTDTGVWMIWEPQNNRTIGELGKTVEPYEVIEVRI